MGGRGTSVEFLLCTALTFGDMLIFYILKYKKKAVRTEGKLNQMNSFVLQRNTVSALKKEKKKWIQAVFNCRPHLCMAERRGKTVNKSWTLIIGLFITVVQVKQFWNYNGYKIEHINKCVDVVIREIQVCMKKGSTSTLGMD